MTSETREPQTGLRSLGRRDWATMNSDPAFLAIRDHVLALVRGGEAN